MSTWVVSASKESHPELNRMLAAAHARAFDAVVCWKLDHSTGSVAA
jgi:DNA invertase Pin-like site-specific DNA recombinase